MMVAGFPRNKNSCSSFLRIFFLRLAGKTLRCPDALAIRAVAIGAGCGGLFPGQIPDPGNVLRLLRQASKQACLFCISSSHLRGSSVRIPV